MASSWTRVSRRPMAAACALAGATWDEISPGRAKFRDPAGNLVELFAEGTPRS